MKRVVVAATAASFLAAGCVSTKNVPLEAERLATMNAKSIAYTDRPAPDFSAMKAGDAAAAGLFGAVGGVAMAMKAISDGNELVRSNGVEDPADAIALELSNALAASTAGTVSGPVTITAQKPGEIASLAGEAQYIVDVQTTGWGAIYFPTDWSHYGITYGAKLRLIEAASNKVVAESFCFVKPQKKEGVQAPTYDEMVADGAKRLKEMLSEAGRTCIGQFKTSTLKL